GFSRDWSPDVCSSDLVLLRSWGHRVTTANDGPSALARVGALRPDVVLLDVGLPGMSGYEVAERLRAEPGLAGLRLVALTGYGQGERKCVAEGTNAGPC